MLEGTMTSFEWRRTFAMAARMVCVAALAAPYVGLAQSGRLTEQQREIVATIDEEVSTAGSLSLDLVAPLTALGLTYHERGDYDLAAEKVEEALQVVRANFGLYSLDQTSLLRLLIATQQEAGDVETAIKLQDRLLALARRHPSDLRTVPILREAADRQLEVAEQVRDGGLPPQISFNVGVGPGGGPASSAGSTSPDFTAGMLTLQAVGNYAAAIQVLVRNELYDSDELRDLEHQLLRISYDGQRYNFGRNSLRRLIAYDTASAAPWLTRVKGVVQIADWDLLYSHNGMALDMYSDVHEELKSKNIAADVIDEFFSPATPVVLPAFFPNPLISPETEDSTGFIDVAFEITKYGRGQSIQILDTTTNASNAARDELERVIKRSRFRPQLTEGAFVRTEPVVVRYYLTE
jgi:tetratricopeptide (TPR) repeat protein